MRKIQSIAFIFFMMIGSFSNATTFKLEWDHGKLPLTTEVQRLVALEEERVGQNGILDDKVILPAAALLKNDEVILGPGETAYLVLLVKNKSKRTISFSVAPHSIHPGESALGFSFNCLCNGHIYTVGPDQIWYRLMKLSSRSKGTMSAVVLKHTLFPATKKAKI